MGKWTANKKTNAFGKSDQEACEIAFISAAVSLQDRARREGGNVVVNIRSGTVVTIKARTAAAAKPAKNSQ